VEYPPGREIGIQEGGQLGIAMGGKFMLVMGSVYGCPVRPS
jgi:hypothetical protein